MGVTNYYSLEGEIIGERTGAVRTDYSRDALGSVTATRTSSPAKDTYGATYRYKPYGARLAKTGTAPDPDFQWVGTGGYRETSISHSESYVRARHYGQAEGRWTTVDLLWPIEMRTYAYANSSPIYLHDPFGLAPDCYDPSKDGKNIPECDKRISEEIQDRLCGFLSKPVFKGALSTEICKLCKSEWCKCTGNMNMTVEINAKLKISGIIVPTKSPCTFKATKYCKNVAIYKQLECPSPLTCAKKLEPCSIGGPPRRGEPTNVHIRFLYSTPIVETVVYGLATYEFCINNVIVDIWTSGSLALVGCKKSEPSAEGVC